MKRLRIDYRHIICIAITIGFVALGVFKFFGAVGRLIESGRDIGLSAAFYFCELFQIPHNITPTVNDFPKIPFFDFGGGSAPSAPSVPIPEDWHGFAEKWSLYWRTWATGENFLAYLSFLGNLLYVLSMAVLCLLPAVVLAYFLLKRFAKTENNDWGKDTKPLRIFKRATAFYLPVKQWVLSFIGFLRDSGVYWKIWLALWLFYFNVFTIVLEFIAFYLYFVVSFDFANIYRQVYKLILDLWTAISFIPLWCRSRWSPYH